MCGVYSAWHVVNEEPLQLPFGSSFSAQSDARTHSSHHPVQHHLGFGTLHIHIYFIQSKRWARDYPHPHALSFNRPLTKGCCYGWLRDGIYVCFTCGILCWKHVLDDARAHARMCVCMLELVYVRLKMGHLSPQQDLNSASIMHA